MIRVVDYIMCNQIIKIKETINDEMENVTKEMLEYKGKTSKIIMKIEDFIDNKTYYLLTIDFCENIWSDEMIDTNF